MDPDRIPGLPSWLPSQSPAEDNSQESLISPQAHRVAPRSQAEIHFSQTLPQPTTNLATSAINSRDLKEFRSTTHEEHMVPEQHYHLLTLPSEIRLQILREVLRFPTRMRTMTELQTQTTASESQGQRRARRARRACIECRPLFPVHDEHEASSKVYPGILRVCRTLYQEGSRVIAGNPTVAVFTAHEILEEDIQSFNLKVREHRQQLRSSAAPAMTIWICDQVEGSAMHLYIFELRDTFYLIRYILQYVRRCLAPGFIDVYLHRFSVPGLYTLDAAAETLFLGPLQPYLNGEIHTVTIYPLATQLFGLNEDAQITERISISLSFQHILSTEDAAKVFGRIHSSVTTSQSTNTRGWDHRQAFKIWTRNRNRLYELAADGKWSSSENWEIIAHRSLCTIKDQIIHPGKDVVLSKGVKSRLLVLGQQIRLLALVIYLNLS